MGKGSGTIRTEWDTSRGLTTIQKSSGPRSGTLTEIKTKPVPAHTAQLLKENCVLGRGGESGARDYCVRPTPLDCSACFYLTQTRLRGFLTWGCTLERSLGGQGASYFTSL